jgi:heme exporter protein CcmD
MIDFGQHAEFIVWGYAGVAAVTLALVAYVLWDGRRVRAQLAALEAQGIRRRSEGSSA